MYCKYCGQERRLLARHDCRVAQRTIRHDDDDSFTTSMAIGAMTGDSFSGGMLGASLADSSPAPDFSGGGGDFSGGGASGSWDSSSFDSGSGGGSDSSSF